MPEAYQYALWRVVPRLDRGESLNVGLVLYSRRLHFLEARVALDGARVLQLDPGADVDAIAANLAVRVAVAAGDVAAGGTIAEMDPSDRFGWLVAPSSTIVQPSQVHTGLTADAGACLERLFAALVL